MIRMSSLRRLLIVGAATDFPVSSPLEDLSARRLPRSARKPLSGLVDGIRQIEPCFPRSARGSRHSSRIPAGLSCMIFTTSCTSSLSGYLIHHAAFRFLLATSVTIQHVTYNMLRLGLSLRSNPMSGHSMLSAGATLPLLYCHFYHAISLPPTHLIHIIEHIHPLQCFYTWMVWLAVV